MHNRKNRIEHFKIWQKGLELADSMQKITDRFSSSSCGDIWGKLRDATFSIPSYLAEGFMMKNIKDGKVYFYRTLNCLDEILKSLVLTERTGLIKEAHIHKIKRDIIELKSCLDVLER